MTRTLTDRQISWMVYAIRDVVARRRIQGQPIPAELLKLHNDLTTTSVAGIDGSEIEPAEAELRNEDLIDSDETAAILGCSSRWVREIHNDLDGEKVRGKWRFPRQAVIEYADARNTGRVA